MSDTTPLQRSQTAVDDRVEDLLSRMTTEEKVGQLMQLDGKEHFEKIKDYHLGSVLQIEWERISDAMDVAESSRSAFPCFSATTASTASLLKDATIFPTPAPPVRDKDIIEQGARVTAVKTHSGCSWTFSPCSASPAIAVGVEVTKPLAKILIIGEFASANIQSCQGDDMSEEHTSGLRQALRRVLGNPGAATLRRPNSLAVLKSFFLPPFKKPRPASEPL